MGLNMKRKLAGHKKGLYRTAKVPISLYSVSSFFFFKLQILEICIMKTSDEMGFILSLES